MQEFKMRKIGRDSLMVSLKNVEISYNDNQKERLCETISRDIIYQVKTYIPFAVERKIIVPFYGEQILLNLQMKRFIQNKTAVINIPIKVCIVEKSALVEIESNDNDITTFNNFIKGEFDIFSSKKENLKGEINENCEQI